MNWNNLRSSPIQDIISWAETQPWCRAMQECLQDRRWHAEGDVWTHTKMVLDETRKLQEWPSLTRPEKTILTFTALLHDVGKPATTIIDPESGHISSPKHALVGEQLARQILREVGCELKLREEIARLVRYHGRPFFVDQRSQPAHEVVKLSWWVNNRLLYLFALSDLRGRIAKLGARSEETLRFWKMQCQELDCYTKPFAFETEHARFVFFRQDEPNLHYVPHDDFSSEVTMVSGLPGSGKDTWLSSHCTELPVVALDEIRKQLGISPVENQGRVAQSAKERCREFLREKRPFAFNATNTVRETRSRWIRLFADYQARIRIIYLEPPISELRKRNLNRPDSVPEAVMNKLLTKCNPPTWSECHQLELVDD